MDRGDSDSKTSDEELGLRYFRGDKNSGLCLWNRYQEEVWEYIYYRLSGGNYQNSRDVYQEVCLRFLKHLKDKPFKEKGIGIRGFLRKIAYNIVIDMGKKQKRNEIPIIELKRVEKNSPHIVTPLESAIQSENAERLMTAITGLSEKQKDVLIHRYYNYKTLKEIGHELEMSEANACKTLKSAKTSLIKILNQGGTNNGTG